MSDEPKESKPKRSHGELRWYVDHGDTGAIVAVPDQLAHPDTANAWSWLRSCLADGSLPAATYWLHREVDCAKPIVETVRKVTFANDNDV